jgi:hypothetical protein
MAEPVDFDPFAPLASQDPVRTPWDWIPQEWTAAPIEAPVESVVPVTPEPAPPPVIPMPAQAEQAPLPPPVEAAAPPPMPWEPAPMQPGLGIPAPLVEQTVRPEIQLTEDDRKASLASQSDVEFAQSDVEFAQTQAEANEARRQMAAAGQLEAAKAAAVKADEDLRVYENARDRARQSRADVEAEAAAMSDDPEADWFKDGGVGRTIFSMIAAVVGGMAQKYTGGRNVGVDMIDTSISRYINERRQNIAGKRQNVAQMEQDAEADFRHDTAVRLAAYENAIRLLDAEVQNYDPKGTSAIALEATKREVLARQAKAVADFEEREIKRLEAAGKTQLEIAKHLETVRKNQLDAENDKIRARADSARAAADMLRAKTDAKKAENETQLLSPAYFAATYPNNPKPPHEMTAKQYADFLEQTAKGPAAQKAGLDAVKAQEDIAKAQRENKAGDLVDIDGEPLNFRDSAAASKVATKRAATDNVTRLLDQIQAARARYGWSSDLIKSDEWRAMKSDFASLAVEGKTLAELGVLAGPDMGLLHEMFGTTDPTEVRDPTAGLKQARANAVNSLNATIVAETVPGQKPKRYLPPEIAAAKSYERTAGQNVDVWDSPLLQSPDENVRQRAAQNAADSIDALARQTAPGTLQVLARENEARLASKAFTPEQHSKVKKDLLRAWKTKLRDEMTAEQRVEFGLSKVRAFAMPSQVLRGLSDEQIEKHFLSPTGTPLEEGGI